MPEFFDPFAETPGEFNPFESMDRILQRYANNEIEHDYTADQFVSDAQALMLDSQFQGLMREANAMMELMHQLCEHDPALKAAAETNGLFAEQHDKNDGHGHEDKDGHGHNPKTCRLCQAGAFCLRAARQVRLTA